MYLRPVSGDVVINKNIKDRDLDPGRCGFYTYIFLLSQVCNLMAFKTWCVCIQNLPLTGFGDGSLPNNVHTSWNENIISTTLLTLCNHKTFDSIDIWWMFSPWFKPTICSFGPKGSPIYCSILVGWQLSNPVSEIYDHFECSFQSSGDVKTYQMTS